MGEVVNFKVKPKSLSRQYKQHNFTVTYVPSTKQWHWCVEIVQTTTIGGDAETQVKAIRAAEKQIDRVMKMQGKEAG